MTGDTSLGSGHPLGRGRAEAPLLLEEKRRACGLDTPPLPSHLPRPSWAGPLSSQGLILIIWKTHSSSWPLSATLQGPEKSSPGNHISSKVRALLGKGSMLVTECLQCRLPRLANYVSDVRL